MRPARQVTLMVSVPGEWVAQPRLPGVPPSIWSSIAGNWRVLLYDCDEDMLARAVMAAGGAAWRELPA